MPCNRLVAGELYCVGAGVVVVLQLDPALILTSVLLSVIWGLANIITNRLVYAVVVVG